MIDDNQIRNLINEFGFGHIAEDIIAVIQPSIRLQTMPAQDDDIRIGESKIGGSPDVPPEFQWPKWSKGQLTFIAQLNLTDMTQFDIEKLLPDSGMLYFFYDAVEQPWGYETDSKDGWRVIYHDGTSDLERTPASSVTIHHSPTRPVGWIKDGFKPCRVSFTTELTLPGSETPYVQAPWEQDSVAKIRLDWGNSEDYYHLCDAIQKAQGNKRGIIHRVLGHPDQIQGNLEFSCQMNSHGARDDDRLREALKAGQTEWQLLLQIDSDDHAGMMWGDVGRIYYCIQKQKLKARDFGGVWFELQCT